MVFEKDAGVKSENGVPQNKQALRSHEYFLVLLHAQVMQNFEAELINELSDHNRVALLPPRRSTVRSKVRRVDIL